jgi:hypothetical protein
MKEQWRPELIGAAHLLDGTIDDKTGINKKTA